MLYERLELEPSCEDCRYYLSYYFFHEGEYVPAMEGECILRRAKAPGTGTPVCESFLPAPDAP